MTLLCHMCWTLIVCSACYRSSTNIFSCGLRGHRINRGRLASNAHCFSCAPETRRKNDGSSDCPLNFAPLGQLGGDHADHPGCWLRVLPGPFPPVQTMSEVHPSTEVERAGRCNSVCQVRRCKNVAFFSSPVISFYDPWSSSKRSKHKWILS